MKIQIVAKRKKQTDENGVVSFELPEVFDDIGMPIRFIDISCQTEVIDSDMMLAEVEVSDSQLTALQARSDVYIVSPELWAQGNFSQVAQWCTDNGITKAMLEADVSKFGNPQAVSAIQGIIALL